LKITPFSNGGADRCWFIVSTTTSQSNPDCCSLNPGFTDRVLSRRCFGGTLSALAAGAFASHVSSASTAPAPERVRFGQTDLHVTRYCQGTAFRQLPRDDNPAARNVLYKCLDVGINFFDSAEAYGWGGAETVLGRVIQGRRDEVVICTKATPNHEPGKDSDANTFKVGEQVTFTRDVLTSKCEGSLKRLGTDYLDLFLLHGDDDQTAPESIADTMEQLVRAGKIRYWGLSNFTAAKVEQYVQLSSGQRRSVMSGTEDYYHIAAGLRMNTALLEVIKRSGLGILAFSPQDCGRLSPGRQENTRYGPLIGVLDEIAGQLDTTRPRLLIAWSLAHPAVTTVLGGAESPEHVVDNVGGTHVEIPDQLLVKLNAAAEEHTQQEFARSRRK
jgi:aryl-alcohol dehydrogenase-like predicted oxidoreductase